MKSTDLMIGDWVYYDMKALSCLKPVTLREAHQLSKLDFAIFQDDEDYTKPIPLTEEILKANGFVNDWKQLELEYIDKGNGWFLVDIEAQSIEDGVVTKWCRYVHEVQHALRLCGYNELADNFKLKVMEE